MKRETQLDKLNALLGIKKEVVQEVKAKTTGNTVGITEENIQKWRELQGIVYFLQAPALFQPKSCSNCGTKFVVSRLFVSCCSYDCITEALRKQGVEWSKGSDLEALTIDPQVYNGNEPIWIRQPTLSRLQEILASLLNPETDSSLTKPSELAPTGLDIVPEQKLSQSKDSSSLVPSQTLQKQEPTKPNSTKNVNGRGSISFG